MSSTATIRRGSVSDSNKMQNFSATMGVWCGAGEGEGEGIFFYDTKGRQAKIKAHVAGRSSSGEVEEWGKNGQARYSSNIYRLSR
jgi:hypothetical protein